MLISVDALAKHIADPDLVLLHVGPPAGYERGHLPGARLVKLMDLVTPTGFDMLLAEGPAQPAREPRHREHVAHRRLRRRRVAVAGDARGVHALPRGPRLEDPTARRRTGRVGARRPRAGRRRATAEGAHALASTRPHRWSSTRTSSSRTARRPASSSSTRATRSSTRARSRADARTARTARGTSRAR